MNRSPDLKDFLQLDTQEIAALVKENGPRVLVCPINGTRRWFALEHRFAEGDVDFLEVILERYLSLFECFFSHGISTLLTPILGPDIMKRGGTYREMVFRALNTICAGDDFRRFYSEKDVRVRFYGDYGQAFAGRAPEVTEWVQQAQAGTRGNLKHRLFWGMFAHDPVEQTAHAAVRQFQVTGKIPSRSDIVAAYYGEYVPPADIFIGMMPPAVFDYPLLDTGTTALYFTTAPTPYLNETMLRRILYDFIFVRLAPASRDDLSESDWDDLEKFYRSHREDLAGIGRRSADGQYWLPVP